MAFCAQDKALTFVSQEVSLHSFTSVTGSHLTFPLHL
uniref:Uncharacterized protein n=1 Tax=Anguilla anguilla TaxID=7936 RepID=A0A0E9R4I2_ANGAN